MKNAILKEEILTNEQLDNIAGGYNSEMANDSRFLNSLNGSTDRYGSAKLDICFLFSHSKRDEIKNAWKAVGITAELNSGSNNEYSLNGQGITQEQARQHAMKVVGKQMSESDWKW